MLATSDFGEWIYETNAAYLDDERANLDHIKYKAILVVANLGLWYGHVGAYKIIDSGKVSDCLYADGMNSLCEWYVTDDGEFCGKEHHHDGTNHMIYRAITEDTDMDELNEILERPTADTYYDDIVALTKPIGPDIAGVYGW